MREREILGVGFRRSTKYKRRCGSGDSVGVVSVHTQQNGEFYS